MEERRRFLFRLTDTSRSGWDRLCADERVTFTALIEAIGLDLAEGRTVVDAQTIERAAAIDRERKSRR